MSNNILDEELLFLIDKNISSENKENVKKFFLKAKELSSFVKNESNIMVVSHLDADGLTSAAIILQTLKREGVIYNLRVVQTVDNKVIEELKNISEKKIIFVDIGSGQLELVNSLKDKKILILDHHEPSVKTLEKNVLQLNPHDFSLDGSNEISGAGTTYFYSRMLNNNKDLAYLAIIGAIGDVQEHNGFIGLNKIILDDAVNSGKLKVKRGVKLFGAQTKNIVSLLTYNQDLSLKDITGSEQAVRNFLEELNIVYEENGRIKKYIDLSDDERKRLVSAMIIKRSHLNNPESIIGYYYTLVDEKRGSPLKDAREYATLLNACGRMDAASIGIAACMGNEVMKKKAIMVQKEYKKAIGQAIRWFNEEKSKNKSIKFNDNYVLIDGRGIVKAEIIGTLASIVSRMDDLKEGTFIISIANIDEQNYKVSIRIKGENNNKDLREIMTIIAEKSSSQAGGHSNAAGALVPKNKILEFFSAVEEVMSKL